MGVELRSIDLHEVPQYDISSLSASAKLGVLVC
jgi:hypothetical protein